MRTLFIHPTDPSTEFGEIIYQDYLDRDDVTVITGTRISHRVIREALQSHDRIVFIGHGTELGMLDILGKRYVITADDLQFFRNKPVICFWCNANIFAEKYDLNAFATGMFVSELDEAAWYNLPQDQAIIDASNILMCSILSRCAFDDPANIRNIVYRGYVDANNPVICFNRQCMGFDE
jgi:hypothetical protein